MRQCLWCDKELESKGERWFIIKDFLHGVCHECVVDMTKLVLRSLQRNIKEPPHED